MHSGNCVKITQWWLLMADAELAKILIVEDEPLSTADSWRPPAGQGI